MPLIDDPPKPLRDVRLEGVLLALARITGGVRMVGGLILAVTYFQTWQVIAGIPWTGYQFAKGSPLPVVAAAGIAALGYLLLRSPTLSRGMISAAGTAALALWIQKLTQNPTSAALADIQLKGAQILFGFTFIVLTFTAFADLIFHPILYMWQRRAEK